MDFLSSLGSMITKGLSSLTGKGLASTDTAFMQAINRRVKPPTGTLSSSASLSEYLKNQTPSFIQTPSSQYLPSSQFTPPATTQPYLSAMQDRISGGTAGMAPVKETTPTTPQAPFVPGFPDPSKTTFSQKVTKKGVFMTRRGEFGGETSTFLRELRPGDIFDGKEIYTHQNEWRDLSTEFLQGKGKLYFKPGADVLARLKNRLKG